MFYFQLYVTLSNSNLLDNITDSSLIIKKAICFVAFLVGFITVLCIGNYFRAKRAQERQRQRRDAKQQANNNNTAKIDRGMGNNKGIDYEAPVLPQTGGASGRLL